MSPFSTLLRYGYLFHDAPLCHMRYDYFLNAAALCLPYSRCCAMTTFFMMLHYVSFYLAAAL